MSKRHKAALARAREIYAERCERGEFSLEELRPVVSAELANCRDEFFEETVNYIIEQVDKSFVYGGGMETQLTLPGWDLEGVYRLGETRRIAKHLARLEHAEEMIANDERNFAAVADASRRKHEELTRLRPYWGNGATKAEAVAAYMKDHENDAA